MSFFFFFYSRYYYYIFFLVVGGGGGEFLARLCNFRFCCLFVRFRRCGFSFMFASYLFTSLYF